jgi:hypothetical protein
VVEFCVQAPSVCGEEAIQAAPHGHTVSVGVRVCVEVGTAVAIGARVGLGVGFDTVPLLPPQPMRSADNALAIKCLLRGSRKTRKTLMRPLAAGLVWALV